MTNALRSSALLLSFGLLAACSADAGDRADSIVSACPAGEQCSSSTPAGLLFHGAKLGDAAGLVQLDPGPATVATGGKETLSVSLNDQSDTPDGAFDGASSASDLLVAAQAPRVVVSGAHSGGAFVRILDPGTDLLQDRIWVPVADPVKISITAAGYARSNGSNDVNGMAVLAGSGVNLVAAIFDASGNRLIDEGIAIDPSALGGTRSAWDTATFTTFSGGTLTATLSGGLSASATLSSVKAVDDVMLFGLPQFDGTGWAASISVSSGALVCIEPSAEGVPVVGETFDSLVGVNADLSPILYTNCFLFSPEAVGPASLAITVGGFTKTFTTTIVADPTSATSSTKSAASRWNVAPGQGERASSQKHEE